MINRTGNHHQRPARLPDGTGTPAPLTGVVGARSATPAVIGGVTASAAKHSAAALNGADFMKHKP
jgi:hypothetical protein